MSRRNYDRGPYGYVEGSSPKPRPIGDLLLNWGLVIAILAVGAWKLEQDWAWYKSELLFYNSIQDGITPAELEDNFVSKGVERNMQYKDLDEQAFFWTKWLPKVPWYVIGLFIPFLATIFRLRRKRHHKLNVPYYIGIGLFVLVTAYFVGQSFQLF